MPLHVADSPLSPKVFLNADSDLVLNLFQFEGLVRASEGGAMPVVFVARLEVLVFFRNEGGISNSGRI